MSLSVDKSNCPDNGKKKFMEKKEVEICMVVWEINDHIDELDEILQGVAVAAINKQFLKYITDNIEPTGWQAIWRANRSVSSDIIKQQGDFVVDVINVSQVTLDATVLLKDIISAPEDHKEMENLLHAKISVPLIELYPTAFQENDAIDTRMTTEVIQHLRFFFDHIWQPWDSFEEVCCYTKSLISTRMQSYYQIKNEMIPPSVASEMMALRQKATKAANEIRNLEATFLAEKEVDQQDVVELLKLNKEVEQLKARYDAFGDPFLRELTLLQEQLERKVLLDSCLSEEPANVLVVASSVLLEVFVKNIIDIPKLLKTLPQSSDVSVVKTFPSLQIALDSAKVGDVIALLPGTHTFKHLGPIAGGGTICGVGPGVNIVGSPATGDVFLDLRVAKKEHFVLHSLELRPLEFQTGIILHSGQMVIQHCSIIGGAIGVCLLSGSECRMEETTFTSIDSFGVQCKNDSELIVGRSQFEKCQAALHCEERAKITIIGNICISNYSKDMNNPGTISPDKELKDGILTVNGGQIIVQKNDPTHVMK